jgi:hypothetical protein
MFKEFYYYVYEIHIGKGSEDSKFLSAILGISYFQYMNFATLWGLLNSFFDFVITRNSVIFLSIIISTLISIINYFYLYRNRKMIIKKVEGFSAKREKIGKTFFVIYIIATLFLMFYIIKNFVPVRHLALN